MTISFFDALVILAVVFVAAQIVCYVYFTHKRSYHRELISQIDEGGRKENGHD